jgi:hypothetical protein
MADIPVFNGSQVIDPSAPVSAVDTKDARAVPEAYADMGGALVVLGNALDVAAKKTKDKEDQIRPGIARDQYAWEAMKTRAQIQAEALKNGDDPSGISAAERFKERMDPIAKKLADGLGNETQRGLFINAIGEVNTKEGQTVIASEVDKREKNIGALREQALGMKGQLAYGDYKQADVLMARHEIEIGSDSDIPDAKKIPMIAEGKKSIARESLNGLIDKGMGGVNAISLATTDPTLAKQLGQPVMNPFSLARALVEKKYAGVFTDEEKAKEFDKIEKAQSALIQQNWTMLQQTRTIEKDAFEDQSKDKEDEYRTLIDINKKNPAALSDVLQKVQVDVALFPEARARLLAQPTGAQKYDDSRFGAAFYTKLYNGDDTKNHAMSMRKDLINQRALISPEKYEELIKSVEGFERGIDKHTNNGRLVGQWAQTIRIAGPGRNDAFGMYQADNRQQNEVLAAQFMGEVAKRGDTISPQEIEVLARQTIQRAGYSFKGPIPGINPGMVKSTDDVNKMKDELAKKYIQAKTQKDKQEILNQIRGLKGNEELIKNEERLRVLPGGTGKTKLFDEGN